MRSLVFALLCVGNMAAAQIISGLGLVDPNQVEKEREVFEDEARRIERYNEFIRNQNQKTQEAIDGLDAALRAAWERQRPKNSVQGNSSIQRQSGGITIIQEAPRQPNSQSEILRRRQVQKKIEAQRARQSQQRAEREERMRLEKERWREQERLRRAEEERRRQEQYNAVRTTEYVREGARTQRLSNEASWRTHEGADMLDRAHTADNLMRKEYANNFSNGHSIVGISSVSGKHRIGSLRSRGRVAITGLDPHAIPWATMHRDALPWSEWGKNTETVPVLPPPPIKKPVDPTIDGVEQWRDLKERLGEEKLNPIIQLVAHETGNHFPDLLYDPEKKEYFMYDYNMNKLMSFSEDGERFTIHELKEKDDGLKEIWQNLKKIQIGYKVNLSNIIKSEGYIAPFASKGEKMKVQGSIGKIDTWFSSEDKGDKAGIKSSDMTLVDVADALKGEKEEDSKKETQISVYAKLKLLEKGTEIVHREYYINTDGVSFGTGYNFDMGVKIKAEAELSAGVRKNELNVKIGSDFIKADGVGLAMFSYGGETCFTEVDLGAKGGYSYKKKLSVGKNQGDKAKRDGEKDQKGIAVSRERNFGSAPLIISGGVQFSCQNNEEVLKLFNDKISGVKSGVGAGFGGGGGNGK